MKRNASSSFFLPRALRSSPGKFVGAAPDLRRQRSDREEIARDGELAFERRANEICEYAGFNRMKDAVTLHPVRSSIREKRTDRLDA